MRVNTRARAAATTAFAAALGLSFAGARQAVANPILSTNQGPQLKLLSPAPRTDFHGTRPIEIDALYEGTPGNGIVSLELYIDGVKAQSQRLNSPESKGIVSFLVDSSLLSPGAHYVVVRATAADAEVRSVRGEFVYGSAHPDAISPTQSTGDENALAWPSTPGAAPQMKLMFPVPGSKVQGTVTIKVDANDENNSTPYVSIFVDGDMKQLVNYRPFEYTWDTTSLSNGWHTIAIAEAFNDDGTPIAHMQPVRVYVNNPGGDTTIRTDLLDGAKPFTPALSPVLRADLPRKSAVQRPWARRPRGMASSAPGMSASLRSSGQEGLIAEADPRWDGLNALLEPSLSAPTLATMPPTVARTRAVPGPKPFRATAVEAPATTQAEGAHSPALLIAEAPMLEETLSPPTLALPSIPVSAGMRKVLAALPYTSLKPRTQRIVTEAPSIHSLKLKIHTPMLPVSTSHPEKLHTALSDTSLLLAVGETRVVFDNSSVNMDRPLAVKNNVMFGPLRRLFEQGGGSLQWHARTDVVQADTAHRDIKMTIGDRHAVVNRQAVTLSSAPYISSGRTMVPISFLSVALNATVQFDPATGHLKITSRQ